MPSLKVSQFGGMLPAWDDNLLPEGQAAYSRDSWLYSGALTGWRYPKKLRDLTNSAAKFAYRVPTITQATAQAWLLFLANANEGDTVTVGQDIYKFTATVTAAFDVLLGGSALASATNLFQAFTLTGTDGVTYGEGTCANPAFAQPSVTGAPVQGIEFTFNVIKLSAPDFGAAYNATFVGESTVGARLTWTAAGTSTPAVVAFSGGLNATFDNRINGTSKWLEFLDPDTTVMRSAVVDDKFQRYYFSSPSDPPRYNTYDRIQADQASFLLGLNPPGCAPVVSVAGGGDLAVLGYSTVGSGVDAITSNSIRLFSITPTAAMSLSDVSFLPQQDLPNAKYAAVLYDDTGSDAPFELLNFGAVMIGTTTGNIATSQFVNPTGLLANVKYWVGIMTDTTMDVALAQTLPSETTKNVVFTDTFNNGPPKFAAAATAGLPTLNMWADLETGSVIASRAYVYTWVTAYGEESQPSPYTLVNGWSNGVWTVGLWTPPLADMGTDRNITKLRLYRTITSTGGSATYYFVAELDIGTLSYTDIITDNIVALNNVIASTTWSPPPEGLENIISMPNGMAVGFKANELWFCVPYQPHAWPAGFVLTTEFPIIGIGISGQSVIACTSGTPYVATGVNPTAMTISKTAKPEPCISRASVLGGDDAGVYYVSPNGLILVDTSGKVTNTTDSWITRTKWRQMTPGKNLRSILLASSYFAFGTVNGTDTDVAQQGFTIELSATDAQSFTIWPQPGGHRLGYNNLGSPVTSNDLTSGDPVNIDNVLTDPWSSVGLLIAKNAVYYYDFSDTAPAIVPYKWRSKLFQQPSKKSFEAMKVFFKIPPGTPMLSADRNEDDTDASSWNSLSANQYGIIRVFADDNLVTTREFRRSGELLRILSGFKADKWQVEVESRVEISNIQMATSVKELGNV